jgi:hypothetical protein
METTQTPSEGRKLNMDEKRKLEKLLLADIDAAVALYNGKRASERGEAEEQLLKTPPRDAAAFIARIKKAHRELEAAGEQLRKLGFTYSTYRDGVTVGIGYNEKPAALLAFDAESDDSRKRLAGLSRTYTLNLFAGGKEVQELFETLASEIKAIVS